MDTSSAAATNVQGPAARPGRRRALRLLVAWFVFGLVAAAGSAVWASGFASVSAVIGDSAEAEPVLASPATTTTAPQWVEAGADALVFDFAGTWAHINGDAHLFEVDLSESDPGHTYQVGVYSTADLNDSGWTALQLHLVIADGPCGQADLSSPDGAEALNLLAASDAAWMIDLDGGSVACVGVAGEGRADDPDGTFARRDNANTSPLPPTFTASANRIE